MAYPVINRYGRPSKAAEAFERLECKVTEELAKTRSILSAIETMNQRLAEIENAVKKIEFEGRR
jgi:hypothetical protein